MRDFSLDLVPETSQYSISRNSQNQNYTVKFTGIFIGIEIILINNLSGKTVPVCKECEMSVLFELSTYYGLRVLCRSGFCDQEILFTSGLNSYTYNELWNYNYKNKVSIYDITDIKETSQASRIVMTGQYKHRNISRAMSRGSVSSSKETIYSVNISGNTSRVGLHVKNEVSSSVLKSTPRNKSQRSWTSGHGKRVVITDRLEKEKASDVSPIGSKVVLSKNQSVAENGWPTITPEDYQMIAKEEDPTARDEVDDLILKYLRDQPQKNEKEMKGEGSVEDIEKEVGKKRIRVKKLNLKEIGRSFGEIG